MSRQAHDCRESRWTAPKAYKPLSHSKYALSHVVGSIKDKRAIHLARVYGEHKRNFVGQSFWVRKYFVSTVGRDETLIQE